MTSSADTIPVPGTPTVSHHWPWSWRSDAADVERRFRLDRDGWRRRIDCARRLTHDGRDELLVPTGA